MTKDNAIATNVNPQMFNPRKLTPTNFKPLAVLVFQLTDYTLNYLNPFILTGDKSASVVSLILNHNQTNDETKKQPKDAEMEKRRGMTKSYNKRSSAHRK